MKKGKLVSLVLLSIVLAVIAASCSSSKPPKEAIVSALTKMQDVKTMTFNGSFALDDIVLPQGEVENNQQAAMAAGIAEMLKGATFNVRGAVQTEPQRAEMTFDVSLGTGDMKFNLSIPVILNKDKMWIKVPQFPMIPNTIAGKFVEFDLKKMMEEQGQSAPDVQQTQKLLQDVMKTALESFDEKTYFSEPKQEEIKGFPEGFKAERFIRFAVTPQNADQAMTAVVDQIAPKVIDLLIQNDSYAKALQLKKEDLEKAKKELEGQGDAEAKKKIEDVKKNLKINELTVTGGIQDGYLVYQDFRMNVDLKEGSDTTKLGAHMTVTYDNLNKDVKFEYEEPKDAIPAEKLQELLSGAALAASASGGM